VAVRPEPSSGHRKIIDQNQRRSSGPRRPLRSADLALAAVEGLVRAVLIDLRAETRSGGLVGRRSSSIARSCSISPWIISAGDSARTSA